MTGVERTLNQQSADPAAATQVRTGLLTQETVNSYEHLWTNRDELTVTTLCGDDRAVTAASAAALQEQYPGLADPSLGGLSIYGQTAGLTKNILVTGIKHYGEAFYDKVGGFAGLDRRLRTAMNGDHGAYAVRAALHSDATKERAAFTQAGREPQAGELFCAHGSAATGCAYCGNLGLASVIVGDDAAMQEGIHADAQHVLGDSYNEFAMQGIIQAHRVLAGRLGGQDFTYSRQDYVQAELPVVILEGTPHEPASASGLLFNLNPHDVGRPGAGMYRADVGAAALGMRRWLPEYNLPAKDLIASLIADARPVRSVLASHDVSGDHDPDPNRLAIGVRGGDASAALQEIERLEYER